MHGYAKQGAPVGYDGRRAYHPLLATRAETGEVLHIRTRKGTAGSSRGALRFVCELIARVERAGACGEKLLRADSAFWSNKVIERLEGAGWLYSIAVRMQHWACEAVEAIPEASWVPLADYPEGGEAQIAETVVGERRLVVRRIRLTGEQAELFPDWRHFAFLTNRTEPLAVVEQEHRQHAVVELAIRDLKDRALAHFPLGALQRQRRLGGDCRPRPQPAALGRRARAAGHDRSVRTARTARTPLSLPGRLARSARQWTLNLPARWP